MLSGGRSKYIVCFVYLVVTYSRLESRNVCMYIDASWVFSAKGTLISASAVPLHNKSFSFRPALIQTSTYSDFWSSSCSFSFLVRLRRRKHVTARATDRMKTRPPPTPAAIAIMVFEDRSSFSAFCSHRSPPYTKWSFTGHLQRQEEQDFMPNRFWHGHHDFS